jgi:hypothetical protein
MTNPQINRPCERRTLATVTEHPHLGVLCPRGSFRSKRRAESAGVPAIHIFESTPW